MSPATRSTDPGTDSGPDSGPGAETTIPVVDLEATLPDDAVVYPASALGGGPAEGIAVWPHPGEPNTAVYLPLGLEAERDPGGRSTLSLMVFGSGGMVQLGARWEPAGEVLEALRAAVARRWEVEVADLRLATRERTVERAVLELVPSADDSAPDAEAEELATAMVSGPPWTALFSGRLDADVAGRVRSALEGGGADELVVRFRARLASTTVVEARVEGDPTPLLAEIAGPGSAEPTLDDAVAVLERGLEDGVLEATVVAPPGASPELVERAAAQARERAAEALRSLMADAAARGSSDDVSSGDDDPGTTSRTTTRTTAHLLGQARLEAGEPRLVDVSVPVASWLAAGQVAEHVRVLGGA